MLLVWQFWGVLRGAEYNTASPEMSAPQATLNAPEPDVATDVATDPAIFSDDSMEDGASDNTAPRSTAGGAESPEAEESARDSGENTVVESDEQSLADTERIMEYINGASVIISITGDLPALLAGYEPEAFGSWSGWEMVFEIPNSEVSALLDELGNRRGVEVTEQNNNSTYAVVLFSRGA